jgi:outer membrane protein assembly factor BamB
MVASCKAFRERTYVTDPASDCTAPESVSAALANARLSAVSPAVAPRIESMDEPIRGIAISSETVIIGRHGNGSVEAFDARSGHRRWRWTAPNWVHNDPQIVGERVIVTYGDNGHRPPSVDRLRLFLGKREGGVAALDLASGRPLWQINLPGSVMTSAIVERGEVIVATGERMVRVFDLRSGKLTRATKSDGVVAMANPRAVAGTLVVGLSVPPGMTQYNLADLSQRWHASFPGFVEAGTNDATPAVDGTLIYTTGTQSVLGRDRFSRDALHRWPAKLRMKAGREPYRALSRQYVAAVDRCSGKLRWLRSVGVGFHVEDNRSGTPVVAHEHLLVGSPVLDEVLRIDRTGRVLWRRSIPGLAKGYVVPWREEVIAATQSGSLIRLAEASGAELGRAEIGHPILFFSPLLAGDRLIVPTQDGQVVLVDLPGLKSPDGR